uniref:Zinc finger FYVE-type containing 27 n=1 Tax=Macaca fascicularis TaxID=9541 RepID=A0A7N9CMY6_MACFA
MRTQPQSDSRPGSGRGGGGGGGGDFRTCDFRTALAGGAAFGRGGPEETLWGPVALPLLLPEPAVSLTEPVAGMQTSEREGSGPELSPSVMPEAPLESPPFPTKSPAFDLFNLVLSYKRLEIYLEPLKDAGDGVRYLLRWQMPLCSLLTCLGLNILFLTLNEGAWYSVGALMISVPALLGYLQEVCRARLPESELMRRKYHSVRQEDLQRVRLSRPEAVAEVKSFLIQLEAFLSRLCCTCEAAYRVLHWENPVLSSQFYGALLGTVCMLYLLPLCWVLTLLNSTLFLGNVEFFRVVSEYRASLQQRMNPKQEEHAFESPPPPDVGGKCGLMDSTPALTPTEEDDEGVPCPAEDELALQDNGFLSKNEVLRSKVSRLTERLRKRYPTNNFGNCTGCSATFSVLKKRVSVRLHLLGTVSLGLSGGEELRGVTEEVWLGSRWAWQWLSGVSVPSPAPVPPFTSLPRGHSICCLSCSTCAPPSPSFLGWDQLV